VSHWRQFSRAFTVPTPGRGTVDITDKIQAIVSESQVRSGLCNAFIHHTSASLIICENADPAVRRDLEQFAARWVPDGDPIYEHTAEGPDDMPAHVRTIFTQSSVAIPVAGNRADLGTWQSVYIWEHRRARHQRRITITVIGE